MKVEIVVPPAKRNFVITLTEDEARMIVDYYKNASPGSHVLAGLVVKLREGV